MRPTSQRIFPANAETGLPDRAALQRLSDQMSDMAQRISRLDFDSSNIASEEVTGAEREHITAEMLHKVLLARRARSRFFSEGLFADPAWDILLDLLMARLSQTRVSVSSLCLASNVPPTTALRWIGTLETEGLLTRRADPLDGRRSYMELSDAAIKALSAYFASLGFKLFI